MLSLISTLWKCIPTGLMQKNRYKQWIICLCTCVIIVGMQKCTWAKYSRRARASLGDGVFTATLHSRGRMHLRYTWWILRSVVVVRTSGHFPQLFLWSRLSGNDISSVSHLLLPRFSLAALKCSFLCITNPKYYFRRQYLILKWQALRDGFNMRPYTATWLNLFLDCTKM